MAMNPHPGVEFFLSGSYEEVVRESQAPGGGTVYVARYKSMPGCVAQGSTPYAALTALRKIREPFIRAMYKQDVNLPAPDSFGEPAVSVGSLLLIHSGTETNVAEGMDEQETLGLDGQIVPELTKGIENLQLC